MRQAVNRYARLDIATAMRVAPSALGERAELLGTIALATSAVP